MPALVTAASVCCCRWVGSWVGVDFAQSDNARRVKLLWSKMHEYFYAGIITENMFFSFLRKIGIVSFKCGKPRPQGGGQDMHCTVTWELQWGYHSFAHSFIFVALQKLRIIRDYFANDWSWWWFVNSISPCECKLSALHTKDYKRRDNPSKKHQCQQTNDNRKKKTAWVKS